MAALPDYYAILKIDSKATTADIRQAYRKESLRSHPDRLSPDATESERRAKTAEFQKVADAYYVLSDPQRRREYDVEYRQRPSRSTSEQSSADFFKSFFASATGTPGASTSSTGDQQPDPDGIFGNVFEDLLRPEVEHHMPLYKYLGMGAGAVIGFILGNIPGAAIGGYGGGRLGSIRDAKGRSVMAVFKDLDAVQRTAIIRALALKVLGSALA
ncbi:uncharacterized protein L969DRAFT_52683 [Mixia osmundae IAM 14324]|uniref:uncharacterized protein n=1 Tax=Mixia osmundae (strain CBS 9802 / IAM 14324 / JCM 22182 / KY 12970) TaxID=764103 RepID=UPI0004A54BE5|nr:uncharacterized protein L969DRAFT_52683 [Mixia osmundae IAM 14324]KEI37747.1 hypothetical protein L969DRAFT_52683 [Mixia osmundae IAM 14324]